MDTICLSSLAWHKHHQKSQSLIARLGAAAGPASNSLHLDQASVVREHASAPAAPFVAIDIPFVSWIRDGVTEDGVLNVETIRKSARDFPANGIVLLDAAGFKSEIVVAALHQARQALYALEQWPALFVLIIDDAQMFQVSPVLASTFQIQPNVLPETRIKRDTRQFMQYVGLLRLFGRNVGFVANALRWRIDRQNRKREHRINRGLGWTWEE